MELVENLPAKVVAPDNPKVIIRDRLFKILDDYRQTRAIWVSGPAGAGKTTLVSSYVTTKKLPVLWYQTD